VLGFLIHHHGPHGLHNPVVVVTAAATAAFVSAQVTRTISKHKIAFRACKLTPLVAQQTSNQHVICCVLCAVLLQASALKLCGNFMIFSMVRQSSIKYSLSTNGLHPTSGMAPTCCTLHHLGAPHLPVVPAGLPACLTSSIA
jgi:hypothetical protein